MTCSWASRLCQNWILNLSFMAKLLHVLPKNDSPEPILWEQQDRAFKALRKSLINLPALGHPVRSLFFFLLCMKRKGMPLRYSLKNIVITRPLGYYSQQLDLVAWPLAFQAPRRGPGVEHTRTTGRETLLDFSLECSFHVVVLWCPHGTCLWVHKRWSAPPYGRKKGRNGRMRFPDPF